MKRLLITTGDVDGVGLEVTAKALLKKKFSHPKHQLIYFSSPRSEKKYLLLLRKKLKPQVFSSLEEALLSKVKKATIEIHNDLSPALWVQQAAEAAVQNRVSALITAPLSKQEIKDAGFQEIGHTDIFKKVARVAHVNMGFIGKHFHTVLATGHIPLERVSEALTEIALRTAIEQALALKKWLGDKRPVAILGLNPHAGDGGLIGDWEERYLKPYLQSIADKNIQGPLSPDAAFVASNRKKYCVFIALYHDQGLIPFKAVHGYNSGVHLSLGLPFVRTSVDHGTAKDIFGKGKANAASMRLALEWARDLT
jgi:4-hydroxythreonine-4-phosphate dehydrogenase